MTNKFGIGLDDAVTELAEVVESGVNFMTSEFSADWEMGEAYYAGKCDLPIEEGRSSIVKTETRDVIRAIMPNVMRIMLQSQKIRGFYFYRRNLFFSTIANSGCGCE